MNIKNIKSFEDLIEFAKYKVENKYGGEKRKWLISYCDSYTEKDNRLEILVYEGSPAKGYVIINYGTLNVRAFDVFDRPIFIKNYNDFRFW